MGTYPQFRHSGVCRNLDSRMGLSNITCCHDRSVYKSCQFEFIFSITFNFQILFQFLIVFSRWIADSIVSCSSYQTKVCTPYLLVKLSIRLFLCSQTRFNKFEVSPVYRVPFRLLASMFTHGCRFILTPCYYPWIPRSDVSASAGMT